MKLFFVRLFLRLFVFRKKKMIINCSGGIGDTVFTIVFERQIIEKYRGKKVVFVCKKSHEELLFLFGIQNYSAVTIINRMISYYCINSHTAENEYVLYAGYTDENAWWNLKGNNAIDDFFYSILKLPGERSLTYPHNGNISERTDCYYGVNSDSVIISPYAVSSEPLNNRFWDNLVSTFIDKGYKVYTNVSKNQRELDHTIRLDANLYDMYYIAPSAKCFIGYRSGICDLLAMSDTNMLVLYHKDWSDKKWDINGFSKKPVMNIIYDEANEDDILHSILDYATSII